MTDLKFEFSKFVVVGGANFLFTLVLFYTLVKIVHLNYEIALIGVSLLGMILTYSLNHVWVFKPEERLEFKGRLFKYLIAGLASVLLNVAILRFVVSRTGADPFFAQLALIPVIVALNFSTAKYWSLRPAQDA